MSRLRRAAIGGVFTNDGTRWTFAGDLTMDSAAVALEASRALPLPPAGVVDFAGLRRRIRGARRGDDRAAPRRGDAEGQSGHARRGARALQSLAVVYGVEDCSRSRIAGDVGAGRTACRIASVDMPARVEVAAVARRFGSVQAPPASTLPSAGEFFGLLGTERRRQRRR